MKPWGRCFVMSRLGVPASFLVSGRVLVITYSWSDRISQPSLTTACLHCVEGESRGSLKQRRNQRYQRNNFFIKGPGRWYGATKIANTKYPAKCGLITPDIIHQGPCATFYPRPDSRQRAIARQFRARSCSTSCRNVVIVAIPASSGVLAPSLLA